ncbi:MAG: hypothetical protein LBR71_07545, partial [Synergistaceae bacterium]|nr:hypothetical protein [Synergistaceae bacterium]
MEETLLTETDIAARRVEDAMSGVAAGLKRNADPSSNPLADVSFTLRNGQLIPQSASPSARRNFMTSFGAFLRDEARLPVYDSVARVYRKGIQVPPNFSRDSTDGKGGKTAVSAAASPLPPEERELVTKPGTARQLMKSRVDQDAYVQEEAFQQASQEGFDILRRNVVSQRRSPETTPDERSRTVSRSRAFSELLKESDGGLLPRLSDRGLE